MCGAHQTKKTVDFAESVHMKQSDGTLDGLSQATMKWQTLLSAETTHNLIGLYGSRLRM